MLSTDANPSLFVLILFVAFTIIASLEESIAIRGCLRRKDCECFLTEQQCNDTGEQSCCWEKYGTGRCYSTHKCSLIGKIASCVTDEDCPFKQDACDGKASPTVKSSDGRKWRVNPYKYCVSRPQLSMEERKQLSMLSLRSENASCVDNNDCPLRNDVCRDQRCVNIP